MKIQFRYACMATVAAAALSGAVVTPASAAIYDANIVPGVIFGSGNANGGFTVDRHNDIELGLRGKLRFDSNNQPQNIYNSNGDGTYSFSTGTPNLGIAHPGWATTTTPIWNFDWSVNTNYDGLGSFKLGDLTYQMGLDFDPTSGTMFQTFDPIITTYADHSIGDNSTTYLTDHVAGTSGEYQSLLTSYIVAQNSGNYEFFNEFFPFNGFDPNQNGTYTIYLAAFDGNTELARTSIDIIVGTGAPSEVPIPGAALLFASGLGALGVARRKKAKEAAGKAA